MILVRFFLFLLLTLSFNLAIGQVVVNEWMSKNIQGIADEDGERTDWLELYNQGLDPIDLGGFALSDDSSELNKWIFPPTTINPNDFLVVFCSGKNRLGTELHTNFRLSEEDDIVLSNLVGTTIHHVTVNQNTRDISEGLTIDGGVDVSEFYQSTPGASNVDGIIHNRVTTSHEPGFYTAEFGLQVTATEPQNVHYTLDGSEPTPSDPVLEDSIPIRDRTNEPLNLSSILTTAPTLGPEIQWETPLTNPLRGTVVRLRSFNGNQPTSHISSLTYIVTPQGANRYSLPIASVITDSLNLFQYDTGIFIPGYHHYVDPNGGGVWGTGNYHQYGEDWERRAHLELFSNNGEMELSQDIGIRVHGTGSRSLAQKSIRLYARSKYGFPKISEEVFPNSEKDDFDILVLRNFGQDFLTGIAHDVLANQLIEHLHQAQLKDRAMITFINGEYWGIQNLRERFDKHFLSDYHELHEDSIDLIEGYGGLALEGDHSKYMELYQFFENNDFSIQANYDHVATMMDIDDFIDNTLTRIYLGCYDWPGNNVKMWRERSPEGKFRWLLLDNDKCLDNADYNSLEHATEPDAPGWPNPPISTLFLRRLLMNSGFRQQFIDRMAELLNTEFHRTRVAFHLSQIYLNYKDEYDEHDDRWSALYEYSSLQNAYETIIDIIEVRSCFVREHFLEYFSLNESEFNHNCDMSELFLETEERDISEVGVYPNPNTGVFDVLVSNLKSYDGEISLIDLKGSLVYSERLNQGQSIYKVNVEGVAAGVYFLRVTTNNRVSTQKLIIQQP